MVRLFSFYIFHVNYIFVYKIRWQKIKQIK